jgi:outer membrane protein TolC
LTESIEEAERLFIEDFDTWDMTGYYLYSKLLRSGVSHHIGTGGLQRSWSAYAQTRDSYRATVLAAFQEVEDGLSLTQRLKTEVAQQHEASTQAGEALWISTKLYDAGLDNYLSVSVAQVAQLQARTSEVQVQVRQMQAAVSLIRAIGGGWSDKRMPTEKQTLPFGPFDSGVPDR